MKPQLLVRVTGIENAPGFSQDVDDTLVAPTSHTETNQVKTYFLGRTRIMRLQARIDGADAQIRRIRPDGRLTQPTAIFLSEGRKRTFGRGFLWLQRGITVAVGSSK